MKKTPSRSIIVDRLHKGFVITCVAITLYGVGHLGMRWYRYFAELRPAAKQKELLEKQNLLAEGASDVLKDSALEIKM
ncbi:uncharacterized protein [Onthophagus taurus]|uniref:uncharacterized protein n=1 Tax=Onthophagus taurus TaxID=166361 RepID=UPI000C1FF8BA|nr:uncharacterized protein LOC111415901 [Onthophagus taurus]